MSEGKDRVSFLIKSIPVEVLWRMREAKAVLRAKNWVEFFDKVCDIVMKHARQAK